MLKKQQESGSNDSQSETLQIFENINSTKKLVNQFWYFKQYWYYQRITAQQTTIFCYPWCKEK